MTEHKAPPIGLKPREIHDDNRLGDILDAMKRYLNAGMPFPDEWDEEYEELVAKRKRRKS